MDGKEHLLLVDADGTHSADCLKELALVCVVVHAQSEADMWLQLEKETRRGLVVIIRGDAYIALALSWRVKERYPTTAVILFGAQVSAEVARAAVLAGVDAIVAPGDCGALCSAVAVRLRRRTRRLGRKAIPFPTNGSSHRGW